MCASGGSPPRRSPSAHPTPWACQSFRFSQGSQEVSARAGSVMLALRPRIVHPAAHGLCLQVPRRYWFAVSSALRKEEQHPCFPVQCCSARNACPYEVAIHHRLKLSSIPACTGTDAGPPCPGEPAAPRSPHPHPLRGSDRTAHSTEHAALSATTASSQPVLLSLLLLSSPLPVLQREHATLGSAAEQGHPVLGDGPARPFQCGDRGHRASSQKVAACRGPTHKPASASTHTTRRSTLAIFATTDD